MSPQGKKGPGDPHITLRLKSTAGTIDEEFNRNNKAQKVLEVAVKRFNLDPTPPSPYVLKREADGRALALDAKLAELGLEDGDVVLIQAPEATDG